MARLGQGIGLSPGGVHVFETPTSDIIEEIRNGGRPPVVHAMARKKRKIVRKEENYLWSTRRFPSNNANNTIGSGAIVAGDYDYFANGIGDVGSSMGYFSLASLAYHQTNMDKGGKIPTGRGFALYELGVSFDSAATPGDCAQLMDAAALRYEKQGGQLVIHHGPLRFWPGGTGVSGFASTTATTTTIQNGSNGVPNLAAVRRFKAPRLLNANDSFRYVVQLTANKSKNNAVLALSDFVETTVWLFGFHYDAVPS